MNDYFKSRNISYNNCGKLIIATNLNERKREDLEERKRRKNKRK